MYLLIVKQETSIQTFETLKEISDYLKNLGFQFKEIIIIETPDKYIMFWGIADKFIKCCEEAQREIDEWRQEVKSILK